jgi:HAD superfamily hydrolase (TIGR01509 family)
MAQGIHSYDLLIFDCDGTLVDSEYMNNLATLRLLHDEGLTQYDMEYAFSHFVGLRLKHILSNITKDTGHIFPADIGERYVATCNVLMDEHLKPIDGAKELVETASTRMKVCVASNGQRENVIESLRRTALLPYFRDEHIFTGVQVKNAKPAPDLFFLAAERMNAQVDKCLVIEDSVAGVTGAKAAGMHVFGFTGAHINQETWGSQLKRAGATEIYGSLIHIREGLFS